MVREVNPKEAGISRTRGHMGKIYVVLCAAVLGFLITACSSSAADAEPNAEEMEIALHARVVDFQDGSMEVTVNEEGIDQDAVYEVILKDCEFCINRDDIGEGYPILIIPADPFVKEETSLEAAKIYGIRN